MKYMVDREIMDRAPILTIFDIGPKQSETPEGYLLCEEVPIARTGTQQYLNEELEPDAEGGKDGIIHVERLPADVFHPDTIASFEGKSITIDHPSEMLSPEDVYEHEVGVLLNVRQGVGDMSDFLLADMLIKHTDAIKAIRDGKRQVSCGYGSDYESLAPGRARQHTIIGNHVAIVPKGRCGPSCAIGDEDMVEKAKSVDKKGTFKKFIDGLRGLVDTADAEFANGEEGAQTFHDESLNSKSGTESFSSVGSDTHIHIHAGPNGSTTEAPTTDKKAKDKKMKDKKAKDDEGTAEEMETEDAEPGEEEKKEVMDAVSKAYDAAMKKISDRKMKDKKAKDKKAKDADEEEEEEEGETADADTTSEGEAESEGSVETADEDEEEEEKKGAKDKKSKDKKSTKDSASLKPEFKELLSDVEILAPGLKLPTFDAAMAQMATMDSMCLLRRRALAASMKTDEGKEVVEMLNGGKPLDLKRLTCDAATPFFNAAVSFARDRNVSVGSLRRGRTTSDTKTAPSTPAEFNQMKAAFYDGQRPKPLNKSA